MKFNEFKLNEKHGEGGTLPRLSDDPSGWLDYVSDMGPGGLSDAMDNTNYDKRTEKDRRSGTAYTPELAPKQPLKFTKPGPNITTSSEKPPESDSEIGAQIHKILNGHSIHGWNVDASDADRAKLKQSIEQLAKDYGVNPRALTGNQDSWIKMVGGFDDDTTTDARHSMIFDKDKPYGSHIQFKDPERSLPHEFAHHASMNFAAVDDKGGMRHADPDNIAHTSENTFITGFGGENAEDKYLSMAERYRDAEGNLDKKGLRGALYKNVFDRESNKQRPELKHALATAVSYILSDSNLLTNADESSFGVGYQYDPEEIWARGFAEFSRLKRLPVEERFDGDTIIRPETYIKIQKLMNNIKVVNRNTMAKGKGRDTGTRTA